MPELPIRRHHRAAGSPADGTHRWHVELEDDRSLDAELPDQERRSLDLSDEELHDLIPTALSRHPDVRSRVDRDVDWQAPVLLFADHFRG